MYPITAYVEPVPVEAHVNEPPHVNEPDENEERENFAEILAGFLRNTDTALDPIAAEKTEDGNGLNLFANAIEGGVNIDSLAGIDLSDAAIGEEHQKIASADHLLNSSFNNSLVEELNTDVVKLSDDVDAQVLSRLTSKDVADMAEKASKEPKDNALAEKMQNDPASQLLAALESDAKKSIEDVLANIEKKKNMAKGAAALDANQLSAENAGKNEKIGSALGNKASEENAGLLNRRDDNPGRLEEFRSRSRKDRVSFEVRDMRTDTGATGTERAYALVETSAGRVQANAPVQEITLELRLPDSGSGQNAQAQTAWETKADSALENMLARELHQNFNGDIVRHASMALRNGGEGTIRLMLHPDTLGNVKIHLNLSDNKITGHIVVESEEAMNAFRREMASLEQAFRESGFAETQLDLSLTQNGYGAEYQEQLEEGSRQLAASNYEAGFDYGTESVIDVYFGHKTGAVNILA